jgi:exonuclease III
MKVISWNLNSRTNKEVLESQCAYLKDNDFDVITLQEVTINSQKYFKNYFDDCFILSSFDLVTDKSILRGNRKYGQLIISKESINYLKERCEQIPFPERVLSGFIDGRDIEVHTTHVPPGSSNGVIKVEHFEGLFDYLSKREHAKRIVTGDFNSPKQELKSGEAITWGQKISPSGKVRISVNPKWKHECTGERWDSAERNIIQNHSDIGLKDAFRTNNEYVDNSASWFTHKDIGRRYDHIFCSDNFDVTNSYYDQEPRLDNLSDHSPLIAVINSKVST